MSNFISKDINPQSINEIVELIKTIKDKMPYLSDLETSTQLLLPKLKEELVPFAERCLNHAQNVSAIAPNYIDIEEFHKALTLFNELQKIQKALHSLTEQVDSTIAITGSDAYVAAISIFKNVKKQADNESIPQIRSILVDLNKIFDKLGDSKPKFV